MSASFLGVPLQTTRHALVGALLLALLLGLGAGSVRAEDPAAVEPEQIQRWIQELRADDFATREAARRGLETHGAKHPELLRAHSDDEDAEVRLLVRRLLKRAGGGAVAAPPTGDLAGLGQVLLPQGPTTEDKALAALGIPTSARLRFVDERPEAAEGFDLAAPAALPWFDAVDQVLSALALRRVGIVSAEGVLTVGKAIEDAPEVPEATSGPFLVRVTEVMRTRNLAQPGPERIQLTLELAWAPVIQVAMFQNPALEDCKAADGSTFGESERRSVMNYGVAPQQTARQAPLLIRRAKGQTADRIDRLTVAFPVTVRHMRRDLEIPLSGELPTEMHSAKDSEGEARVRSLGLPQGTQRHYGVELTLRLPSPLADQSLQLWLLFEDGRRERLTAMGGRSRSADGTLELTTRAWIRGRRSQETPKPRAVAVQWFEEELQGTARFELRNIPIR